MVALLIVFLGAGIVIGSFSEAERRVAADELYRARSYFTQILITRRWNASFGGVYVLKVPGIESNPYLKKPDVILADGRVMTLRNPAFMTRELSEIARQDGLFTFHITSLKPINPKNTPDEFEQTSLEKFERGGEIESIKLETRDGRIRYRYIAPLITEKSCLACHEEQGYKEGDIRGGISIDFDVTDLRRSLTAQRLTFGLFSAFALIVILSAVLFLIRILRRRLDALNARLLEIATTDELTGLANRRRFMECLADESARARRYTERFCVVILDIDHFKAINDEYGHPVGDEVLKEIGKRIADCIRTPDVAARYGGEEFSVIITGADAAEGLRGAERIRIAVSQASISVGEKKIAVTISGGVAAVKQPSPEDAFAGTEALAEADKALYRAKAAGRNRVLLAE